MSDYKEYRHGIKVGLFTTLKVGDRFVCTDNKTRVVNGSASYISSQMKSDYLKIGKIYTITRISKNWWSDWCFKIDDYYGLFTYEDIRHKFRQLDNKEKEKMVRLDKLKKLNEI